MRDEGEAEAASFLKALATIPRPRRGPRCDTCKLSLALRRVIAEQRRKGVTFSMIALALQKDGHGVGVPSLERHARDGHDERPR